MNPSIYKTFSVINNSIKSAKKLKKLDLYEYCNEFQFNRSSDYILSKSKTIYNDIENHYYSYDDLIVAIAYNFIFKKSLSWNEINNKNILNIKKLFTQGQLEQDKKFIIKVCEKINHLDANNPLGDLFKINEDGKSIIYELVLQKNISPYFYIYFKNSFLTLNQEYVILNKQISKEYKKFEFLTNLINQHILTKELSNES
jgi:hypothetical protein